MRTAARSAPQPPAEPSAPPCPRCPSGSPAAPSQPLTPRPRCPSRRPPLTRCGIPWPPPAAGSAHARRGQCACAAATTPAQSRDSALGSARRARATAPIRNKTEFASIQTPAVETLPVWSCLCLFFCFEQAFRTSLRVSIVERCRVTLSCFKLDR